MVAPVETIYRPGNVVDLIKRLEEDLSNTQNISRLGRIPEPRAGRKYRELLLNMFLESGSVFAIIVVDYKDGTRRTYTFSGKVLPSQGGDTLLDLPVSAEGHVVEKRGGVTRIEVYNPYVFPSAKELFKLISEFGEKYRAADYEVYIDKMMERINLDTLMDSDVGG